VCGAALLFEGCASSSRVQVGHLSGLPSRVRLLSGLFRQQSHGSASPCVLSQICLLCTPDSLPVFSRGWVSEAVTLGKYPLFTKVELG